VDQAEHRSIQRKTKTVTIGIDPFRHSASLAQHTISVAIRQMV
jgi:hypothetical protein